MLYIWGIIENIDDVTRKLLIVGLLDFELTRMSNGMNNWGLMSSRTAEIENSDSFSGKSIYLSKQKRNWIGDISCPNCTL